MMMKKMIRILDALEDHEEQIAADNQKVIDKIQNAQPFLVDVVPAKTVIPELNEEQKTIINSIEDKWLKWGVCFNREIEDNNLTFSDLNPLDFDFSKMQTIKKIFQEKFDKNQELTTKDYNLIGFLINEDKNDNINESFDKLKNILDNKKEDLNKKWLNEDEFFNHFYKNIKNIVEYKSLNNFKTQIKNMIIKII